MPEVDETNSVSLLVIESMGTFCALLYVDSRSFGDKFVPITEVRWGDEDQKGCRYFTAGGLLRVQHEKA